MATKKKKEKVKCQKSFDVTREPVRDENLFTAVYIFARVCVERERGVQTNRLIESARPQRSISMSQNSPTLAQRICI